MIKAFVFDMDGVILDTETISFKTWEIAANEFAISNIKEANHKCMGTNRHDTYEILREFYGRDFPSEKFIDRTSELFDQIAEKDGIALLPFVEETLEYLSKKYRLALATSTRKCRASVQLKNAGVDHYFETMTFGDEVVHSKPDPEIYLTACASLNLAPTECAAIEDSFNGIKSASAAKMLPIMIPDKVQPTEEIKKICYRIFNNLRELKEEF